jgi:heme/copper-type cytochrome/quinol oxidase subunit 2
LVHGLLSQEADDRLSLSDTVSDFSGGCAMATLITLSVIWAVITLTFAVLVLYRRSLTKQESDWIPLTDDAKEDKAIEAQTIIEMKTKKLTVPIRALGTLSVLMLLVILGFWLFHSMTTPPPMPE